MQREELEGGGYRNKRGHKAACREKNWRGGGDIGIREVTKRHAERRTGRGGGDIGIREVTKLHAERIKAVKAS